MIVSTKPAIFDRRDIDFLLFDWLAVDALLDRPLFMDHSRDTLAAVLDLSERLAYDNFLPHYKKSDADEPRLVDGDVRVLPEIRGALRACAGAGLIAAPFSTEHGGSQLPQAVFAACEGMLMAANVATAGYVMLTVANARLILKHGTRAQAKAFVAPQLAGVATGTMCLSEPQAGSSLGDISTRAVPDGESELGRRFRLFGNKMWISGGDHDAADNIIHLVLAKVPAQDGRMPAGTSGISLFVVPKFLPAPNGAPTRNDVSVAGLNHKMGYRGISNCLLNFGEGAQRPEGRAGAVGFLLGDVGSGLSIMFGMMNEARIAIGLGAAMLGCRGFLSAVGYARERLQGRPLGASVATSPVPIIEHPDVKRMLLAQKAYGEGGLALVLYGAHLADQRDTHPDPSERRACGLLLDLLTPVVKTWPSEWGLAANDFAIQVHGGYGYTRDFDVEQLYRDNRLNPIHEGTTGIQAIDFVRRKIISDRGMAFALLQARVMETIERARGRESLVEKANTLDAVWKRMDGIVQEVLGRKDHFQAISNATPLLQAFGHAIVGWLWLDVSVRLETLSRRTREECDFCAGKLRAGAYFFDAEIPKIAAWLSPVELRTDVAAGMTADQF